MASMTWEEMAALQSSAPPSGPSSKWRYVEPWRAPDGSMTTIHPEDYQAFLSAGKPKVPAKSMTWEEMQSFAAPTNQTQEKKPSVDPTYDRQDAIGAVARALRAGGEFLGGGANSFVHGATAGMDRLALPAIAAPIYAVTSGKSLGEAYDATQHQMDMERKLYANQHPGMAFGGELTGAVTSPLMTLAGSLFPAAKAATTAGKVGNYARTVGASGATGGAFGFGMGEGGFENRLQSGKEAGALGMLIPGLGIPAWKLGGYLAEKVSPLFRSGQERLAGRVLNEATGGTVPQIQPSPIAGLQPTAAQSMNNPQLASLTATRGSANPNMAREIQQGQNQVLTDTLLGRNAGEVPLSTGANTADASSQFVKALREGSRVARQAEGELWNVPALTEFHVSVSPIKNAAQTAEHTVARSDPGLMLGMISDIRSILNQVGHLPDLAPVSTLNSYIGALRSIARRPPENNLRAGALAGRLADAMAKGMDDAITTSQAPGVVQQAYRAARDFTRQRTTVFGTQDAKAALNRNSAGNYTRDASVGANPFFNFSRGSSEGAQNIVEIGKFLNNIQGQFQQASGKARNELIQGARDFIIARARDAATGQTLDQAGEQLIRTNSLFGWLQTNKGWMQKSGLFNKAQVDLLDRLQQAAEMVSRQANGARVAGSDIYRNLVNDNRFMSHITAQLAARSAGMAGGAVAEAALGGGTGGLVGALAGGEAAVAVLNALSKAPREATIRLVDEALRNPKIARDLMMKASNQNARLFSAETRAALRNLGIVLPQETKRHFLQ